MEGNSIYFSIPKITLEFVCSHNQSNKGLIHFIVNYEFKAKSGCHYHYHLVGVFLSSFFPRHKKKTSIRLHSNIFGTQMFRTLKKTNIKIKFTRWLICHITIRSIHCTLDQTSLLYTPPLDRTSQITSAYHKRKKK